MTDITIATILKKVGEQLDWRGPNGKSMGVITLTREEALHLDRVVISIIKERDDLVFERDKNQREASERLEKTMSY